MLTVGTASVRALNIGGTGTEPTLTENFLEGEIIIRVDCLTVGIFAENCFILSKKNNDAIIIDPGAEAKDIIAFIERKELKPLAILCTHAHLDHVDAVGELKSYFKISFYLHKDDMVMLRSIKMQASAIGLGANDPASVDNFLKDSEVVTIKGFKIRVLHTPGHTPGAVCLLIEGMLFSGDTLFAGSIGRTDLPGGSYDMLIESIQKKILPLGDDIKVFPGHGPSTTIGEERQNNPFLIDPYRFRGMDF